MLNYVWSFLLLTGLLAGALFGRLEPMMGALFDVCKAVVLDIALPLAGTMMLWLGILRVMEKAGLMEKLAWLLSPILKRLFPEVPPTHPAMGAMTMNIAANMLGLGNSATPLGLKAMSHLQELNPNKQSASNAMCMFLALNTAGFTLIPMTAINYLNAGGVANPQAVIAPTLIATLFASIMGISAALLLQKLPVFRAIPDEKTADTDVPTTAESSTDSVPTSSAPASMFRMTPLRKVLIIVASVGFLLGAVLQFQPEWRSAFLNKTGLQTLLDNAAQKKKQTEERKAELKAQGVAQQGAAASDGHATGSAANETSAWRKAVMNVSVLAIPVILLIAILWGLAKGVAVYEEMVEGAKEGFGVATRIMPFLVVMLSALTLFRESGALLLMEHAFRPVLDAIGMPVELLPLAIMRPLSGSGSAGLLNEIILNPISTDTLKYTAAILFGSTETTFYVLAVYYGSVGIRRIRHSLAAGLLADLVGMGSAIALGALLFS